MARIEWVRLRLQNWAMWKERENRGGLGFYTQSAFLNEVVDHDRYREAVIPVDEVDASLTDQAVESLKPARRHLYDTLQLMYVRGQGVKETARRLGLVESSVRARLDEADRALSEWFRERAQRMERARMQAPVQSLRVC